MYNVNVCEQQQHVYFIQFIESNMFDIGKCNKSHAKYFIFMCYIVDCRVYFALSA